MPRIFSTLSDPELYNLLMAGAVGVMPSDTIYGLMCRAADETAAARLYKLKSREHKPGTIIAANIDQLINLGIKARYLKAVEQYWPGPVSVIIPSRELKYIHQGVGGIAVRVPRYEVLNELLTKTGPLLTSSANHPGKPPANNLGSAQEYFGDRVDFYVDGGDLSGQKPSTVIRIVDDAIEVIRQGAVTIDEATGRIIQ